MSGGGGIWVRIVLDTGAEISGFVARAESPNDFWITFKTQLVRLERATETGADGRTNTHESLHVNRDRIVFVKVLEKGG